MTELAAKCYRKIYAVEPDKENIKVLKKNMVENRIRNICIIDKGVYKETTVLSFRSGGGEASHINEQGDILIPVVALDDLVRDDAGNLFIKMDIEGSEMDALKGASKTITNKHPVLAISVYHKEDDLITIPQYIDSLVSKGIYKYYLGFHGNSTSELVFYAVTTDK